MFAMTIASAGGATASGTWSALDVWSRYGALVRVTFLHNPTAGEEQHEAETLVSAIRRAGHEVVAHSTKHHAVEALLREPADLVAVAGGDGTVEKVGASLAGRSVPMAILPIGTANNIADTLGVRGDVSELIAGWRTARRTCIDVGVIRTPWGKKRFLESVGVGVFVQLLAAAGASSDVGERGSGTNEKIDRALAIVRTLIERRAPQPWRVTVDGRDVSGDYLLVEVMNIQAIGPRLRLAPAADPTDGALDVVLMRAEDRAHVLRQLAEHAAGSAADLTLPVRRGQRVEFHGIEPPLHVDDELLPDEEPVRARQADVIIEVEHAALDILVGAPDRG
jgi:diacylglycerol kinase family enzyme